jgi:Ca-activated chloride channel family protein
MKRGVADFFARLRPNDLGEVVNFDSVVEVVQPFTSDRALLQAAALAPWDMGTSTMLYDAVHRAIDDASSRTAYRRAVIVTTDGMNTASAKTLDEVIAYGVSRNVAVFPVGIGSTIDAPVLQRLADETGGVFYRADVSQNLATIYQQLTSVLLHKQYVLQFNQLPRGSAGVVTPVTVGVVGPTGLTAASPAANIASCN